MIEPDVALEAQLVRLRRRKNSAIVTQFPNTSCTQRMLEGSGRDLHPGPRAVSGS